MFRTEVPLTPHPSQLPLAARVLTIGSCFSDTIGSRLAQHKVDALVNPFGTVFNPLSACMLLRAAAGEEMDWQQHLVEARGRWQSYDLPAEIGAESPVVLLEQIREVVARTGRFLESADVVVLTLGTAFAYRLAETQELVSNCHKIPAEKFEKELLTPDEVINAVAETHAALRLKNPKLRFILTVSPVRHLKDTLPLNAVSKSVLRVACHYLSELLPDVSYFPAYELLLDDLRDYRFYAADMLHPSEVAENYIWERFTRTYFDQAFGRFKKEWEAVQQALGHRPLYAAAPEHRTFLENTLERLQKLAAQADVRREIREVQQQLAALPLPPQPKPLAEPEPDDDEERIDIGEAADVENTAPPASVPVHVEHTRPIRLAQPPVTAAPVVAVPEPVAEELPDQLETAGETEVPVVGEVAPPKKKRRSRGGAKRTARKNAARAALEAAQQTAVSATSVTVAEPVAPLPTVVAPEAEAAQPEPEVPLLRQELEIIHELPVVEPAPTPAPRPVVAYERSNPRPHTDWLVPMKDDAEAPTLPKRQNKGIVRTPPARKNVKAAIVAPPGSAAKSKATLPAEAPMSAVTAAPVASEPELAPETTVPTVATAADATTSPTTIEEATAAPKVKAAVKTKAAPKKTAAPKAATQAAAKPAVAKAPAKPKAARAPRKPAAAPVEAPPVVAAPVAEAAPAKAAPKKRVRPPRKKPAQPDETA
ncbi:GSCFA family protein [Hymenobacter daecheongensis DSM 21074]|uniref:GSCFA family protein n=1 Tax=Hymenobacter daecheongensis DSM 21074 TaxID=1121955 RepID=A0A1M6C8E0_9BACT|nr:GSCFA domain-containing protein [Hymenobacter daecheongensis]SHI57282.1 GSCFA family protein [Hymenobacter daecheongensis DSM 21074]